MYMKLAPTTWTRIDDALMSASPAPGHVAVVTKEWNPCVRRVWLVRDVPALRRRVAEFTGRTGRWSLEVFAPPRGWRDWSGARPIPA